MTYPWQPYGIPAPQFVWTAPGDLSTYLPEPPGGFDGMSTNDPALSGPGPFDGIRAVTRDGTLTRFDAYIRVPATVLGTLFYEVYRVRGGVVTSMLLGGIASAAPNAFAGASGVPSITDIEVGDLLFVAIDGLGAPAGTADFTISLWVSERSEAKIRSRNV